MEKEKATIYDFARFCEQYNDCEECPIIEFCFGENTKEVASKANETILNWVKEHPVKTRQSEFLKMFPNAALVDEAINICPRDIDNQYGVDCNKLSCYTCKKKYWLEEVEENE